MKIKFNEKEYTIKFGNKALAKSGVLAEVQSVANKVENDTDGVAMLGEMIETTSKLLLAGLQKFHADEFGVDYDDNKEVSAMLDTIYDLLDDYEDSDDDKSVIDLFSDLFQELVNNGFFRKSATMQTPQPQDHLKKASKKA